MLKRLSIILLAASSMMLSFTSFNYNRGNIIDSLNGVDVYYNGTDYTNVSGRNVTPDGYNLGLKYQCVEFVKRYYYEYYGHKMPNSYGHAKDFFDKDAFGDMAYNEQRGLTQYRNVREFRPQVGDILVYDSYPGNPFGHVAIISRVKEDFIEVTQQNIGTNSRKNIPLVEYMGYYTVADYNVLGWLRL